jgi:hypothetical protein
VFNPSREQVRDTFFEAWRKYRAGEPLVGIEALAVEVALAHPEYHAILDQPERHHDGCGYEGKESHRRQSPFG